jgi:hypothetical protein
MKKIKYILLLILSMSLHSCFPDDIAVSPHSLGDSKIGSVEMTKFYSNQLYFNLNSNTVVKQNVLTEWDLGFECSPDGFHIVLNHAKIMSIAHTNITVFNEITNYVSLKFKYEGSEGYLDSTAIGNWWTNENGKILSKNEVMIVNRGTSDKGRAVGYKKIQLLDFTNAYLIKYANLDGSEESTLSIPKNSELIFQSFTFESGGRIVDIEPKALDWDIVFTRYTQFFNEVGYETYSVIGVFINTKYVSVSADSTYTKKFEEIKITDVPSYIFTNKRDAIGYDWKKYKFDAESYAIDSKKIYLIKISHSIGEVKYYKMRFTDFYKNVNGKLEKGYPKFEFLPL